VRRIPIVDAGGRCLGIISQADIARAAVTDKTVTDEEVALVLEQISQPSNRSRARETGTGFSETGVSPQV